ncbi:gliding motility lipoprotein GldD [Thermophagus xiamenensis]|uniref:Gliding motility-associated lipoprotein GldD n=1 Tax=Thermophagus xiamenensis TaxID=385682 RepID=A0A1I1YVW8_9BACT|nr:gliding motility lipoprotein GldD [Thermophagus xiamenensis]SFE23745.1 gliding motility-associated lipoprotein GldD [Thermophagus xiamenensis]
MKANIFLLWLVVIFLAVACNNTYPPKPRGYFRIALPPKEYVPIDTLLPYSFERPVYSKIVPHQGYSEPYWIDLLFPQFKAQVHFSYKPIEKNLYQLFEDNRELAFKHTVKADAIKERLFEAPEKEVYGILYEIKGNTASPIQFFVTDSVRHFLRGSLYFDVVPNKDSIAPVLNFIKEDLTHLIETITWRTDMANKPK